MLLFQWLGCVYRSSIGGHFEVLCKGEWLDCPRGEGKERACWNRNAISGKRVNGRVVKLESGKLDILVAPAENLQSK